MALIGLMAACVQAQSWVKKDKAPEKSKGWLESFELAKKEASAFKQPIFAFFTGSDPELALENLRPEVWSALAALTQKLIDVAAGRLDPGSQCGQIEEP